MTSPRPILKSASRRQRPPPVVHFPPSPVLTRAFPAHSPTSYDRSPIRVQINECALPERGCPGRTYTLSEEEDAAAAAAADVFSAAPPSKISMPASGRHLHPRSLASSYRPMQPFGLNWDSESAAVPSLIPDISSESSEESDDFASPPANQVSFTPYAPSWTLAAASCSKPIAIPPPKSLDIAPLGFRPESPSTPTQLAFLPHAPSAPDGARPRRRKDSSKSARRSDAADGGFKQLDLSTTLTSCSLDDGDDGCLAGF